MTSTPRVRSLLRQANRVEDSGKRAAAEDLYRKILEESPDTADAWAGLGNVIHEPEEKEEAYNRALEIDSENMKAKVGLAEMRGEPIPDEWLAALEPEPDPEPEPAPEPAEDEDPQTYELVCYRHANRSTSLRCYNCTKPICISCANKTSVGYLCPDCLRDLEDKFYNATAVDYIVATLVSLPLSLIAGFIVGRLPGSFFLIFIMILAGGAIGSLIGRVTKRAVGGRRGRYLPHLVVAMMILGVLVPAFIFSGGVVNLFGLLVPGIYLFVASGSAFYWMK